MFFYFASGILAVSVNFVFGERNWQKQDDLKKSKKIWFQKYGAAYWLFSGFATANLQ